MTTKTDPPEVETRHETQTRLYRSTSDRILGGICGGLGEYFAIDPIWFRIGFVMLALGGGSGVLIYLLMWLIVPPGPGGTQPVAKAGSNVSGTAVVGVVLIMVGAIALLNTFAPWLGQYFWPTILVFAGLALVMGGINRDNH